MTIQEVYPENIDRELYSQALDQCVITGHRLFNQSTMDVWFEIDGFIIKVPAGKRILCTGWDQVRRCVEDMDQEEFYGCAAPVGRCGFKFLAGHKLYIYNDLLVFSPDSARAGIGYYGTPERTLEEHIALINAMQLDKATIIAEDLNFLPRCPTLKSLRIIHAAGQDTPLDFSPLYELPNVERLGIAAPNDGLGKGPAVQIDFTKVRGIRHLSLCTNDRYNYPLVPTLETLSISNDKRHTDMNSISCSRNLKSIDILICSMKSLDGIGKYPLQSLSMSYMRSLQDISALADCGETLRFLAIDACGKIKDFSCLYELKNLKFLQLHGSNTLPDLSFIKNMPNLKILNFTMAIADGDLTPCLTLPYATFSRGKKNYNLKDKDLPKNRDTEGFRLI